MSEEKKNQRTALIVSSVFHVGLLILFFFLIAWKKPDPPLPEYGIELNFGLDDTGSGEAPQPEPTKVIEEEPIEEVPEEQPVEQVTETPPVEEVPEPIEEVTEPVEEVEEPVEEVITETQEAESPVVVEEKAPAKQVEVVEKVKEPVPKPKQESLYPGSAKKSANQGDDAEKVGDKGKEDGKIDERAIYGAKGSADGASLQMAGWNWDNLPRPNDPSNENGRIVFQITIDDQGEIIGVKTLEKTVSPAIERLYREAVADLTFSRTSTDIRPAATSIGKITFIIRAK